jgi:hypothetical protein
MDIYRDGGSHSASFLRADGQQCTLFFKISAASFSLTPKTFRAAQLQEEKPRSYTSPITGITDHFTDWEERDITWDEALQILRELEPQLSLLKSAYAFVLPVMISAAENQGVSSFR